MTSRASAFRENQTMFGVSSIAPQQPSPLAITPVSAPTKNSELPMRVENAGLCLQNTAPTLPKSTVGEAMGQASKIGGEFLQGMFGLGGGQKQSMSTIQYAPRPGFNPAAPSFL